MPLIYMGLPEMLRALWPHERGEAQSRELAQRNLAGE